MQQSQASTLLLQSRLERNGCKDRQELLCSFDRTCCTTVWPAVGPWSCLTSCPFSSYSPLRGRLTLCNRVYCLPSPGRSVAARTCAAGCTTLFPPSPGRPVTASLLCSWVYCLPLFLILQWPPNLVRQSALPLCPRAALPRFPLQIPLPMPGLVQLSALPCPVCPCLSLQVPQWPPD